MSKFITQSWFNASFRFMGLSRRSLPQSTKFTHRSSSLLFVLETLISSRTRVKLLLKFFLNERNSSWLRGLEQEFGEGSNAIRVELNRFEQAGLLRSYGEGNKKVFQAETCHPLFKSLQALVRQYAGIDSIIEHVAQKIGTLSSVWVAGNLAKGLQSTVVELALVGDDIDRAYVARLCARAEPMIGRKISFLVFEEDEFGAYQEEKGDALLMIWDAG